MLHCPTCGHDFADEVRVCPEDGSLLQADATVNMNSPVDPLIGRTLDEKYRLDERLGTGGMGTVYRATHLLIDRPVAIKLLNPRYVEDEEAQLRFRREARAAGRIQHTNAVTVTDFGRTTDGFVYIVMELLEGRTLRDVLAHDAPLDTARSVSMMLQISAAVGAAHEAGVIHRDMKPANIFVVQRKDAPPYIKVLDFGIAKLAADALDDDDTNTLTQVGAMIGTPRYMSPEQCDGAKLTPASDVYSLGIILYEMLTGTTPFNGTSPIAIAIKHSQTPPRSPREFVATIPPALEEVVLHALEKRPEDRPADANAFRSELYAVADRLGLEHAASISAPTLETLRNAGTETPSGRLVIDIERLRESRAASIAAQASAVAPPAVEAGWQSAGNGNFAPPVPVVPPVVGMPYPPPVFVPQRRPAIARFRIFFGKNQAGAGTRSGHGWLISMVMLLALGVVIAIIATRSSGKIVAASNMSEALNSMAVFGTKDSGTSLMTEEGKNGASRRQGARGARESRRVVSTRPQPKKPSKIRRFFNKINPF
jgi:serine/threonine-protein kinase